jgi:hypothetical protein
MSKIEEYDLKLESEIKKLGFKKRWFQDRSGYWMFKIVKYKDLDIKFTVQSDTPYFGMGVKTYSGSLTKLKYPQYEDVKLFKCDLKTIKEVIKKYK